MIYSAEVRQEQEALALRICRKHFDKQQAYDQQQVGTWISQANEDIVNGLSMHNQNFKYLVTMQAMQKKQGGLEGQLTIDANCHWNASTDGHICLKYENNSFYVFVTIFGLAL